MTNLPASELALLFLNNLAGDDLWEYSHLVMPEYEKYETPQEFFRYKEAARPKQASDGLHVTSLPYELRGFGKLQLYGFPFLPFYVDPFDIEYALPIQGLIVTEDMRMFDYFLDQNESFFNIADPQHSYLAWAKSQNTPTLLAVHHAGDNEGDTGKLTRLVGMELFCPVLWHAGELDENFFRRCVETMMSEIGQYHS